MQYYKLYDSSDNEKTLTFKKDNETVSDFRTTVMTWKTANYPSISWDVFFQRIIMMNDDTIVVNLE